MAQSRRYLAACHVSAAMLLLLLAACMPQSGHGVVVTSGTQQGALPGDPTMQVQIEALKKVAAALLYSSPLFKTWASSNPCDGTWTGVLCARPNIITQLDLHNRSLSGSLSPFLGNLTGLLQLRLNDNGLTGGIPPSLGRLRQAQEVQLQNNALTGAIPGTLGGLVTCTRLYLWGNSFTGEVPTSLRIIPDLRLTNANASICNLANSEKTCVNPSLSNPNVASNSSLPSPSSSSSGSCPPCTSGKVDGLGNECACVTPSKYRLRFLDLNFAEFDAGVESELLNELAGQLQVARIQLQVVERSEGSVVLGFNVIPTIGTQLEPAVEAAITEDLTQKTLKLSDQYADYEVLEAPGYVAPSTDDDDSSSDSSSSSSSGGGGGGGGLSGGAIAGIVIGSFFGLLLILVAAYFIYRWCATKRAAAKADKKTASVAKQLADMSKPKKASIWNDGLVSPFGKRYSDSPSKPSRSSPSPSLSRPNGTGLVEPLVPSTPNRSGSNSGGGSGSSPKHEISLDVAPSPFNPPALQQKGGAGGGVGAASSTANNVRGGGGRESAGGGMALSSPHQSMSERSFAFQTMGSPMSEHAGGKKDPIASRLFDDGDGVRSPRRGGGEGGNEAAPLSPVPVLNGVRGEVTKMSLRAIQQATQGFDKSTLLGDDNSRGRMYKADFSTEERAAAAVVVSLAGEKLEEDEFVSAAEKIAALSGESENLVALTGICTDRGQRWVSFEFMPNGSLQDHLHGDLRFDRTLDWPKRVQIAVDAAKALAFLHERSGGPMVHKEVSSANLMLDGDFRAKLKNVAIDSLVKSWPEGRAVSSSVLAAMAYQAPEFRLNGEVSSASDVFSFGVVLLELLTGRKPLDATRPKGQQSLLTWVLPQLERKAAIMTLVDPYLRLNSRLERKDLQAFALVAARCLQHEPEDRPKMSEAVAQLSELLADDLRASRAFADSSNVDDYSESENDSMSMADSTCTGATMGSRANRAFDQFRWSAQSEKSGESAFDNQRRPLGTFNY